MSWSKISTADLCGQLFYYRYVENRRSEPTASMLRGKGPHRSAEANYTAQLKTGERLDVGIVKEIAATATRRAIRAEGVRSDPAYEGLGRRLASVLVDESVALAAVYREQIAELVDPKAVELKIEIPPSKAWPFTFVGVIDLITVDDFIRDTKTKRKAPAGNTAHESGQLTAYDLLFRARFGRPSAGQKLDIIWRTPAKQITKHVTLSTTRATHQVARFAVETARLHQQLEAEIYIPAKATDWICSRSWCEFTDICPVFNAGSRVTT